MKALNASKSAIVASDMKEARDFYSRLRGLIGRDRLEDGEGLWINNCRAIHTFGMRFSIDVLFLDKRNIVVAAKKNIPPGRLTSIYFKAESVLELPAGSIESTITEPGDTVEFL